MCGPLMRPASAASSSLVIPLSVLLYLEVTPDACPLLGRRQSLVPEAVPHHESCIYAWVLHFSTPPSLHSHSVSAVDELTGAARYSCLDIRHRLGYVSTIQIYVAQEYTQTLQGEVQSPLSIID